MPSSERTYTATEAAAFAGIEPGAVRKALEQSIIPGPPRSLPFSALVYLDTIRRSELTLSVENRKRLYRLLSDALNTAPLPERLAFSSVWELSFELIVDELVSKLERFNSWKDTLVTDPKVMGGATVYPQSRLTIHRVASLLARGEEPSVIFEDYPNLSQTDLEFAPLFVKAYPQVGRPSGARQATH